MLRMNSLEYSNYFSLPENYFYFKFSMSAGNSTNKADTRQKSVVQNGSK